MSPSDSAPRLKAIGAGIGAGIAAGEELVRIQEAAIRPPDVVVVAVDPVETK
jgi:hypothetical protein